MKKTKTFEFEIASGRRAEILLNFASQSGGFDVRPNEILDKLWGGYSELYEITTLSFIEEILTETELTLINDMIKSVSDSGGNLDIINSGGGYIDIEFWGGKNLTNKSLEIVSEFLDQYTIPHYFNWRLTSTGQDIFNALELLIQE
jgi:hypothetical protein